MLTTLKVLLLLVVPMTAQAHSGRTDANGGHMNRKTGQYHCHKSYCSAPSATTPSYTPNNQSTPSARSTKKILSFPRN